MRAKYTAEAIPMRKRALRRDYISYIHFPYVVISKASHPPIFSTSQTICRQTMDRSFSATKDIITNS